jgi:hypothetical protein
MRPYLGLPVLVCIWLCALVVLARPGEVDGGVIGRGEVK